MTTDQGTTGAAELDLNTLVTPTNQSLNPNANIFQSKLPSHPPPALAGPGECEPDENPIGPTALTAPVDGYQYINGDINKLRSHRTAFAPAATPGPSADPSCVVMSVSDYATNGPPTSPIAESIATYAVATPVPSPTLQPLDDGQNDGGGGMAGNEEPRDGVMPMDQLKAMLTQQLEYYFSRENLANDSYLLSQMDSDQYVPIWTVANFNQIKKLTKDLNLIVEVLRESSNVQVDDAGEKVRPNHKRCIVILREIAESTPLTEVEALFKGENCPRFVSCEFAHNNSWYVTFDSDEDAQKAYRYLREEVVTFQGKSIMARIKAKPITRTAYIPKNGYRTVVDNNVYQQSAQPQQQQQQPQQSPHQQPQPPQQPQQQQTAQRYLAYSAHPHVPSLGYNSQQLPVYAFPPFYPPSVLQSWGPANSTYCDIGSVFTINGLAPQAAFKPNGPSRHNFTPRARRRKKDEDPATLRNQRPEQPKSSMATKESKILPKFDLEAASFPPLPGTADPSSIEADVFENRMSDVVKGTAKPLTRDTKTQTSAPLSPVFSPAVNEASVLTNGDAFTSSFAPVSPPPSPIPRCRNTLTADKATKTDEFLSSADEQGSQSGAAAVAPFADARQNPTSPVTRLQSGASAAAAAPDAPAAAVRTSPTQATPEPTIAHRKTQSVLHSTSNALNASVGNNAAAKSVAIATTNNNYSDSMRKLSYAQMAQLAKEKVEKLAQEQKEQKEIQEREKRIREREMATLTTVPKPNLGPRNSLPKDGRLPRDSFKGPQQMQQQQQQQRDKFAGDRDRFPRKNRTIKSEMEFRDEQRDRRKDREMTMMRPKSPK